MAGWAPTRHSFCGAYLLARVLSALLEAVMPTMTAVLWAKAWGSLGMHFPGEWPLSRQ